MALLVADLGNSRLKWALYGGAQLHSGTASYREHTPEQLWRNCWGALAAPQRLVVASVAPVQIDRSLAHWCETNWGIRAQFLRSSRQAGGVTSAYRDPSRLGVDRWAAMVGAWHRFPGHALCIADCGTAVTVDRLDSSGRHLGGIILPGPGLMRESLRSATAGIVREGPATPPASGLGQDTGGGLLLGCSYAVAGALERVAQSAEAEEPAGPLCLLTGGAAAALLPYLSGRWRPYPGLVLEGARVLADEYTEGGG